MATSEHTITLGNFMNSATLILDNGSHFNAIAHNLAHEPVHWRSGL